MRFRIGLFVIVATFLCILGCNSTNPNKARASQLFNEINQINQESSERFRSDELWTAMKRLNERKKDFPNNRDEIKKDTEFVRVFFVRGIEDDRQTIQRYEELLTLGIAKPETDCLAICIKLQRAMIERAELTVNELDLIKDDKIGDNETLNLKTSELREKGSQIDRKVAEIESEKRNLCSKSMLGIK